MAATDQFSGLPFFMRELTDGCSGENPDFCDRRLSYSAIENEKIVVCLYFSLGRSTVEGNFG